MTPFVMVVALFPADLIGTGSGVVNTFCFVGSLLIPVRVGMILDTSDSFPAAFTRETGLHRRPVMVT